MSISPYDYGRTQYFAENFSASVLAGATGTIIATINVPPKARMRLKSLGNYLGSVAAWGSITWHIVCNGIPCYVAGSRILDQIGYAAQRELIENVEFGGGSTFTITADNATAGAVSVGVSLGYEFIYQE